MVFITLQGLPTAIEFGGMDFVTTEPAPIVQLSPIVTPAKIMLPPPIQQFLPMVIAFAYSMPEVLSIGSIGCVAV